MTPPIIKKNYNKNSHNTVIFRCASISWTTGLQDYKAMGQQDNGTMGQQDSGPTGQPEKKEQQIKKTKKQKPKNKKI